MYTNVYIHLCTCTYFHTFVDKLYLVLFTCSYIIFTINNIILLGRFYIISTINFYTLYRLIENL